MASNDETRFALNGVNVEPVKNGNLLVATDGRKLAAYMLPGDPVPKSFIIPKWEMRFVPARIGLLDITQKDDNEGTIVGCGPQHQMPPMIFRPICAKFPNWKKVVPKEPLVPVSINVNALILEPLLFCARAFCPGSPSMYFRTTADDRGPICVFINDTNFFGIIMPIRIEGEGEKRIPDWIKEEEAK